MKIVVGLGNPGPKYETTRHNAGFLALDRLIDRWRAQGPSKKYDGEVYQADVRGEKVVLAKPQTFMNVSGKCVGPLMQFYKCAPEDLIVIYDELDLEPLTFRLKTGGGTGGHNGLKSIDAALGGQTGYHRVRVGIGHPRNLNLRLSPADYVLQQFSDDELERLDPLLDQIADAVEMMVGGNVLKAMNQFNTREKV